MVGGRTAIPAVVVGHPEAAATVLGRSFEVGLTTVKASPKAGLG
jgi:hypothetical protein